MAKQKKRSHVGIPGLSRARKAAGLTQRELGVKIGVTQSKIAAWECGLANTSILTLERLSEALGGVTLSELLRPDHELAPASVESA